MYNRQSTWQSELEVENALRMNFKSVAWFLSEF